MSEIAGADQDIQYIYRISSNYDSMSKTQKQIANYLLKHRGDMLSSSITVLAKKIGTTPSAITRFCQYLNYQGFSELKFYMGKELLSSSAENKITDFDSLSVIAQKLLRINQNALSETMMLLDQDKLQKIAKLTAKANRVHFYGEGATGLSAGLASAILMQIGIPCTCYNDAGLMRIATASLEPGDIAYGITYSGEAMNVIDTIQMAAKSGAVTVAVTSRANSTLASSCHYQLIYSSSIEDELIYLPVARICETAIFGLLQMYISRQTSLLPEKMKKITNSINKIRANPKKI